MKKILRSVMYIIFLAFLFFSISFLGLYSAIIEVKSYEIIRDLPSHWQAFTVCLAISVTVATLLKLLTDVSITFKAPNNGN